MAGPHRPGFYIGILVAGFIAGGALTALLRQTLPDSAARTFFTSTWTANFGPVSAQTRHELDRRLSVGGSGGTRLRACTSLPVLGSATNRVQETHG